MSANPFGIDFVSSGDPEQDARDLEAYTRHERNVREGLCPNGCAPMEWPNGTDAAAECPKCGCITNQRPI